MNKLMKSIEKLYNNQRFIFESSCIFTTCLIFMVMTALITFLPSPDKHPDVVVLLLVTGWYFVIRWRLSVQRRESFQAGYKEGYDDGKDDRD